MTDPEGCNAAGRTLQSVAERRREPRRHAPANRISWTREGATETVSGWVSDVAESSIAFVTPARHHLVAGEPIALTLHAGTPSEQHRYVRVVRTSRYDGFFSVVGCRDEPKSRSPDRFTAHTTA